jgi:hypothetical protein
MRQPGKRSGTPPASSLRAVPNWSKLLHERFNKNVPSFGTPHDEPNSQIAVEARASMGLISTTGPLLLVVLRSVMMILGQAVASGILYLRHDPSPWHNAGYWWKVYATAADISCLLAMRYFLRREGLRLRDLLGPVRLRFGRDIFLGLGYFLLAFPFFMGGSILAQRWLYSNPATMPGAYIAAPHTLPAWAVVYSLFLWYILWSPTEEATYQAYSLPRLRALTGRTSMAVVIVGFWWAAQHATFPFILDPRYLLFRILSFLPGVLVMMLIYWRTRRLLPVVIAHWPMDIAAAIITRPHF